MDRGSASWANAVINEGDFYVEPDCCMLCGVPEDIAPEIFETGENHCSVRRQPCSQDELDRTIRAMWAGEVDCIRYRGRDAGLLDRLARGGMIDQADHRQRPDTPATPRDRVSFRISVEADLPTSAAQLASTFRNDMRASGTRVLPALFGRRTIWVSWFKNRFHRARLEEEGNGRFVASLRSRDALQGLSWRVDDWLRERSVEDIRWEASGDPTSASPTPL